jgi:hypothetical protein
MSHESHHAIGLHGRSIEIHVDLKPDLSKLGAEHVAQAAMLVPFEVIKPYLSDRPLRRPNRNKPIRDQQG